MQTFGVRNAEGAGGAGATEAAEALERARRPSGFLARLAPLASGPCVHVGIDENGLGPVLGPLVVTGVAFRFAGARPTSLGALVGDSKALVSHGDVSLGEAWARALLGAIGPAPKNPAEIIERVSIDDASTLRAPCPKSDDVEVDHRPSSMCWPAVAESFAADEALVDKCARALRSWSGEATPGRFVRKTKMECVGVRSQLVCPSRLNEAASRGRHRFLVDLHAMETIAVELHAAGAREFDDASRPPLDAVCGKVGGMDYYGDYFGPLAGHLRAIEAESGLASAYRFPHLGRLTFLQDADAADPLVGLASIVGKYLRELLMGRVVRYMRASLTPDTSSGVELPDASGYRDPSTKRFIAATELVRAHRGIPDRCFLR